MIGVIARRETQALFRTPRAWIALAVTLFLLAYQFLAQIELFLEFQAQLSLQPGAVGATQIVIVPTFALAALLLLVLVPTMTMHTIAGERCDGTLKLLYSAPLDARHIVIGKYFGLMSFFVALWALLGVMTFSLALGTVIDVGTFLCASLGLFLLMATYTSIGLLMSSWCATPAMAASATLGILMMLWVIDWASRVEQQAPLLSYLSTLKHFQQLSSGIFDSTDIAYFLIVITSSLALSIWRIHGDTRAR